MNRSRSALGRATPLIAARLVSATISLSVPLVLARTMAIENYGTYKQLLLVFMSVAAVIPLGLPQSLYFFIPRTDERRAYLTQTLALLALAGAAGGLGVWLAGPVIARGLSNPGLLPYLPQLAAFIAFHVAATPLEVTMTARGNTRAAAAIYFVSDAVKAAVLVVPSLTGHGLHGMMAGMVALSAARLAAAWTVAGVMERGPMLAWGLVRGQLAYSLPFGAAVLFSIPQQYAHQFIVANAVGPAIFAFYAVGCFELPFVDLFYSPTCEVLMVHLGELDREGRRDRGAAAFRDAVERLAILLLPPSLFIWAVAPTFIETVFGARFADSVPIFRIALLVIPLAIWPLDATLRAYGETQHILTSYVVKAVVTIPLAWVGVHQLGLTGAVGSYVLAELFGRAFLASRVPRTLSTPGHRGALRELVPARWLAGVVASSVALSVLGVPALEGERCTSPSRAATACSRAPFP